MKSLRTKPEPNWLNKVPEVTLMFWIIKMMCTTVGETAADLLNFNMKLGLTGTSVVTGVLLLIVMFFQVRSKRYSSSLYWLTVVLISVFGTLITDNLTDRLGVPLAISTGIFSTALIATFSLWYAKEKTLSIHAIDTVKRELFYWAAILFTFALGTAAGDWLAEGLNIGYANSALLFGGLIALTAFAHFVFKADVVASFWIAYVLTRPFGASCGDLLSQPANIGGLGFGVIKTSAFFLVMILAMVIYLTLMQKDPAKQTDR